MIWCLTEDKHRMEVEFLFIKRVFFFQRRLEIQKAELTFRYWIAAKSLKNGKKERKEWQQINKKKKIKAVRIPVNNK